MNADRLLNEKARAIDQGAIRIMFDKARGIKNVISLGIGEPNQDTHPDICRVASDALINGYTHYAPNAGMPVLLNAISEKGLVAKGIYDPDGEIIVTNGGMGAFALVMQVVLETGDEVLIQDPQYLNFATTVRYCGGVPVRVPTTAEDGFQMRADTIRRLYKKGKTKMLIINSPNNPTGEVTPYNILKELSDVAKELDLLVLSDEVYSTLLYDDATPLSIASFSEMKERTVVLNSFSKAFAMTGWRIGYAAGPRRFIEKMTMVQEYFNSCINTASQIAAAYALDHKEFSESLREEFSGRRDIALKSMESISGINCRRPKGAFYLFPDISAFGLSSTEFCERLLRESKVVCVPGSAFGECGEGFIRISYATETSLLAEALERFKEFCNNKC